MSLRSSAAGSCNNIGMGATALLPCLLHIQRVLRHHPPQASELGAEGGGPLLILCCLRPHLLHFPKCCCCLVGVG